MLIGAAAVVVALSCLSMRFAAAALTQANETVHSHGTTLPSIPGAAATPGLTGEPSLAAIPSSVPPGGSVAVRGAHWPPENPVFLFLQRDPGSPRGSVAAVAMVANDGSFQASINVPYGGGWETGGEGVVLALTGDLRTSVQARFVVLPPTPTPTPTASPTPTATATPCLPDARFVTDVEIPDNTVLKPGQRFTKIWRMQSSGCAAWPEGVQWAFVSGDRMDAPATVRVSPAAPGATVDISVDMQAPATDGSYKGYWQLITENGAPFGDQAFVLIQVQRPTPTPDLRPTVQIPIINETGGLLTLNLSGPADYTFRIQGAFETIRVIPGRYHYVGVGCGGARREGEEDLTASTFTWTWWCGKF